MPPARSRSRFTRLTKDTAPAAGPPLTFALAASVVAIWATGPLFGFSDTWQLVNTSTTFLMVFPDSNHQESRHRAMQVKPDDLEKIRQTYRRLARKARTPLRRTEST